MDSVLVLPYKIGFWIFGAITTLLAAIGCDVFSINSNENGLSLTILTTFLFWTWLLNISHFYLAKMMNQGVSILTDLTCASGVPGVFFFMIFYFTTIPLQTNLAISISISTLVFLALFPSTRIKCVN